MIDGQFLFKVIAAGFAAVGIEEFLKNFFQPKNHKWYAVLIIPLSIGTYCAAEMLPIHIIGSLLTLGSVQICYETLIQGFHAVIQKLSGSMNQYDGPKPRPRRRENHDL